MKSKRVEVIIEVDEFIDVQRLIEHIDWLDGAKVKKYNIKYGKTKRISS